MLFSFSYSKPDRLGSIYHECAHLEHFYAVGAEKYNNMGKPNECIKRYGKVTQITDDFMNDKNKQEIANLISDYAPESPLEFVAEVKRKKIEKKLFGESTKLDDDIETLYDFYTDGKMQVG